MKKIDQKIASALIGLVVFVGLFFAVGSIVKKFGTKTSTQLKEAVQSVVADSASSEEPTSSAGSPAPSTVDQGTKEKISQDPPKHKDSGLTTKTTTGSNGAKTTTVSEGNISQSELTKVAQSGPTGTSPLSIKFTDETGRYPELQGVIENYLNSTLRWGNEISSLYQIIVRDAGTTGWSGQYAGSYTTDSSGQVISTYGVIYLNTSYYQNLSTADVDNYMKLVFSHEYGHHYTLYHKWLALQLPNGTRFPDAYYNLRPLSKSTTAPDYSLGWGNCDAEIAAEDYSYFYSGFGMDQMASTYGYPSLSARTWFDGLANLSSSPASTQVESTPAPAETTANPPVVSFASPGDGATVSGKVSVVANISADNPISRVDLYIDDQASAELTAAPYDFSLDTTRIANGTHSLKIVAYNTGSSANTQISVIVKNMPMLSIVIPSGDPYSWSADLARLDFQVRTGQYVPVVSTKIYVNDVLASTVPYGNFNFYLKQSDFSAGTYVFRFEGVDKDGNVATTSITINKL